MTECSTVTGGIVGRRMARTHRLRDDLTAAHTGLVALRSVGVNPETGSKSEACL